MDVDINMPGWLYISEYFPVGEDFQGEWIAYKWEVLESGLWRLGPFTAADNEPEGQHVYRIWFYGDGQWAAEDPNAPQENLVYWTYSKGLPAEQLVEEEVLPQPPINPVKEATFLDKVQQFITKPIVLAFGSLILVVIAVLDIPFSDKGLEVRSEFHAVGRVHVDHLDLAAHALVMEQRVHHHQGVSQDHSVDPLVPVHIGLEHLVGDRVLRIGK